jgi:hypothetical protein
MTKEISMSSKLSFVAFVLASLALAACSSDPAQGEHGGGDDAVAVSDLSGRQLDGVIVRVAGQRGSDRSVFEGRDCLLEDATAEAIAECERAGFADCQVTSVTDRTCVHECLCE